MYLQRNTYSFLLALFTFSCAVSAAETDDWMHRESIIQSAQDLCHSGSCHAAETLLQQAIQDRQQDRASDVSGLLNAVGQIQQSQSLLLEAKNSYSEALRVNKGETPIERFTRGVSLNNLGTLAERNRRYAEAEDLFRQALSLVRLAGYGSDSIAGSVETNLAMSLQRQGRLEEPAMLYTDGLEKLGKAHGESSTEYAKALSDFGLFEFETGHYSKALELQQQACGIELSSPEINDRDKAFAMNNLALTLLTLGRFSESEGLFRRALQLNRKSTASTWETVNILNNLAVLEQRTERLSEARRDQTEALDMAVKSLPATDPLIPLCLTNLGRIAASQGSIHEAKELFLKAEKIWQKIGAADANYAATLSNLAGLEDKKSHHKAAWAFYSRSLILDEKALGLNHPRVAVDLTNVAVELCNMHHYREAIPLLQRALVVQQSALGSKNLEVARTMWKMATAYRGAKDLANAECKLNEAINTYSESTNHGEELTRWMFDYGNLLKQEQKYGEAEEAFAKANGALVHTVLAKK